MAENREKLFDQFPPVSTETWKEKVVADLKGADFDKKLVWRTNEGFNVQPMYRAEDIENLKTTDSLPGEYPFIRGTKTNNEWYIRQAIVVENVEEANAKAKDVTSKGITSLGFKVKKDELTAADFKTLLDGINVEKTEINIEACPRHAVANAKALVEYLTSANLVDVFKGSIKFDPFVRLLKHGVDFTGDIKETAMEILAIVAPVKNLRVFTVDSVMLSDAGAYISQELGYALSWGNEWMAQLTEAGISADEAAKRIKFNMGISSNYFMEIAKFRAARWLWAEIVAAYNPECKCACKMNAHAQTSEWNMTVYDAHVNLLRSQTEAMSAALAGVDSITVRPFDKTYQTPDDFSERIARNQQLLLKEECHLDKVVDPSAGSYYVEVLTNSLADVAWKLFLEVEDKGGFGAEVVNGNIQNAVNASNVARKKAVATRREILLGSNQFPNFTEVAAGKIKETASCCCGGGHSCGEATVTPLDFSRGASEFEALRLATENSGKTPNVFMLTIGNLSMRIARSQFSSNFFACAGYKVIDNLGFETVEAGVEAAMKAGAQIVVLCSSDDEYAEYAPAAYKALAGRAEFVVAGAPECMEDLKAQGIDQFINVKSNVLETLKAFNAKLGIA